MLWFARLKFPMFAKRYKHCSSICVIEIHIRLLRTTHLVRQTTLGSAVETDGVGLHTAVPVHVRLLPAPPDTGYVFRRTDLGGFEIPATVESVAHCGYATTLMRTGVMLSTVEHLLSALRGSGVDNVYVEVDNLEIPILDGSAEVFAEMIEKAGIVSQPLARRALLVRERVSFEQGNRRISVEPGDHYQIDCLIDFPHPMIGSGGKSPPLAPLASRRRSKRCDALIFPAVARSTTLSCSRTKAC